MIVKEIKPIRKKAVKKVKEVLLTEVMENAYMFPGGSHREKKIALPTGSIRVCGLITGCGLGQLYGTRDLGYCYTNKTLTKEKLLELLQPCANEGMGAVIGTLGMSYYNHHAALIALGFVQIAEYLNTLHGKDYTQRLYILKLK